jgi:hypothetical protein
MDIETKNILISLREDIREIKEAFVSLPKWISLTDVAHDKGLTSQAVRKKLIEHFEPEVDYKYKGGKIYIARSTVSMIKRDRK